MPFNTSIFSISYEFDSMDVQPNIMIDWSVFFRGHYPDNWTSINCDCTLHLWWNVSIRCNELYILKKVCAYWKVSSMFGILLLDNIPSAMFRYQPYDRLCAFVIPMYIWRVTVAALDHTSRQYKESFLAATDRTNELLFITVVSFKDDLSTVQERKKWTILSGGSMPDIQISSVTTDSHAK